MKKVLFLLAMLTVVITKAQLIKPLSIGDKVPDVIFKKMLNHKASSGKLSDFKGKAIIIDMWFRECASCIYSFPKLDSIERLYKDDLKVLLVTWQSEAAIREFWDKRKDMNSIAFTQVVEDTTIRALFPANSFPHQIWIGKDGYVKSINGGGSSLKEIKKFLDNETLNIKLKQEERNVNIRKSIEPMIASYFDKAYENLIYYSYFGKYRKEFAGDLGIRFDKKNNLVRVVFQNHSIANLYHLAYSGNLDDPYDMHNRVVTDKSLRELLDYSYETGENLYNYDMAYPDSSSDHWGPRMVADLDRYMGIKSHEEERPVPAYIIRPLGNGKRYTLPLEENEKRYSYIRLHKGDLVMMNKQSVFSKASFFLNHKDKPVYLDLPPTSQINLRVHWDTDNLEEMNRELAEFDLEIVDTYKKIKVIVLEKS